MKKLVVFSAAIFALFSSCKNDDGFVPASDEEIKYVEAFEKAFGKVPENQNWDFYTEYANTVLSGVSAETRAPGRVRINRHDRQQSSIDANAWRRYFPEAKNNSNVGTRNFSLLSPGNGHIEIYAVWYGGQIENYAEYKFEVGLEANGEEYKLFDGKGDTSPKSSDPAKFSSNPNFCAHVQMDPATIFRLYIKYIDYDGNSVTRYCDDGYASLINLYNHNKNRPVLCIGFEDSKESEWGKREPDLNDCVLYIEGATEAPLIESKRFFCEDMGTIGDFDYNDVVFDVHPLKNGKTEVRVVAVGGTLPVELCVAGQTIQENGETDLHEIFGSNHEQFNVGGVTIEPKTFVINAVIAKLTSFNDVSVRVKDNNGKHRIIRYNDKSSKGEAITSVPVQTQWMREKENIRKGYPYFFKDDWYNKPVEKYLVDMQ